MLRLSFVDEQVELVPTLLLLFAVPFLLYPIGDELALRHIVKIGRQSPLGLPQSEFIKVGP